ncbi:MAG TPA: L,D-transpeptidase [Pyrinomonadaceae bacterium]
MTNGSGLLFVFFACAGVAVGAACGARVVSNARAAGATSPAATPASTPAATAVATLTGDEEELNRRPLRLPLREPRVVVEKGARRLKLYAGGELVRVRRVALGFEPAGDKVRQGDGRTPEGEFYVCMKNERSKFYLSLGLSYPNEEDAARGLRDGLITRAQHYGILRALKAGRCPAWGTALGGEIFIHGGGTASDWTWGCVALENPEIKELFDALPAGAPVRIEP